MSKSVSSIESLMSKSVSNQDVKIRSVNFCHFRKESQELHKQGVAPGVMKGKHPQSRYIADTSESGKPSINNVIIQKYKYIYIIYTLSFFCFFNPFSYVLNCFRIFQVILKTFIMGVYGNYLILAYLDNNLITYIELFDIKFIKQCFTEICCIC